MVVGQIVASAVLFRPSSGDRGSAIAEAYSCFLRASRQMNSRRDGKFKFHRRVRATVEKAFCFASRFRLLQFWDHVRCVNFLRDSWGLLADIARHFLQRFTSSRARILPRKRTSLLRIGFLQQTEPQTSSAVLCRQHRQVPVSCSFEHILLESHPFLLLFSSNFILWIAGQQISR